FMSQTAANFPDNRHSLRMF
ncbi:hypothetical protein D018_1836B, partial [Vibrio parahaemolyticus VP2007-007]